MRPSEQAAPQLPRLRRPGSDGDLDGGGSDPASALMTSQEPSWEAPDWDQLVRQHSARVYRLAYRLTGNHHDAEDISQEVFIRVFRNLSRYTPQSFEGWLHRITTNLFLDQARRKAKIRFELGFDDNRRSCPPAPGVEVQLTERMLDSDIEAALTALPPEFRVAVVLCDIEGLSYEEIGRVCGIRQGTVRSRIHRGRSMLRVSLQHRAPAPGRLRYWGFTEPPTAL